MEKLEGLDISAMGLNKEDTETRLSIYTNNFHISWLGSSGVTNSAVVQQENYDGKSLGIE